MQTQFSSLLTYLFSAWEWSVYYYFLQKLTFDFKKVHFFNSDVYFIHLFSWPVGEEIAFVVEQNNHHRSLICVVWIHLS